MERKSTKRVLFVLFCACFLSLHIYVKYYSQASLGLSSAKVGQTLDSFEAKTIDDRRIHLGELAKKNKIILLNFWETWCGPCQVELPALQELRDQYKDQGFEVVAVFSSSDVNSVRDTVTKLKLSFLIVDDRSKSLANRFKVQAVPTTIILDANLKILRSQQGFDFGLKTFLASEFQKVSK